MFPIFSDNCVFNLIENCIISSSTFYVYSPLYTIFCIHLLRIIYICLNGCICIYIKTKCLCPSLLVDIHLNDNIGDNAAITPQKLDLNLNFTSFGCLDEKRFGNVHQ